MLKLAYRIGAVLVAFGTPLAAAGWSDQAGTTPYLVFGGGILLLGVRFGRHKNS
jgi:hypothetical protein